MCSTGVTVYISGRQVASKSRKSNVGFVVTGCCKLRGARSICMIVYSNCRGINK